MKQWEAVKRWLNSSPGKKRGIAAILLSLAFGFEYLGYLLAAEGLRALNYLVESVQIGTGLTGVLMTVYGWWYDRDQKQKGNR